MDRKLTLMLQKVFWVLGWVTILIATASMAFQAYNHFNPPPEIWPKKDFSIVTQLHRLVSTMGQAFFAFLVSSIFGMVFHRAPIKKQQTEAFLTLTCFGFIGEGIFGIIDWIQFGVLVLPNFDLSTSLGWMSIFNHLLNIFPNIISFVYAITIFILFRHFTNLVTFESEVV